MGYYTNSVFPTANITPLTYAYFDDYDLDGNGTADYAYHPQSLPCDATLTTITSGLPTLSVHIPSAQDLPIYGLSGDLEWSEAICGGRCIISF
jgi:hypothetical protein